MPNTDFCTTYEGYAQLANAVNGNKLHIRFIAGVADDYSVDELPFLCAGNFCDPVIEHDEPFIDFAVTHPLGTISRVSVEGDYLLLRAVFYNDLQADVTFKSIAVIVTPDDNTNYYALFIVKAQDAIGIPLATTGIPKIININLRVYFPGASNLVYLQIS